MSAKLDPLRISDDVFEIQVTSSAEAQSLAAKLREAKIAQDVVAGIECVSVCFDPRHSESVLAWLSEVTSSCCVIAPKQEVLEIDIRYGGRHGPDLDLVCSQLELSVAEFIRQHTAQIQQVDMIGFTPGFAYVAGLPNGWNVPRLGEPRKRVAAGSVGISGSMTGIYSLAGPGGWPLIGQADVSLFNANSESPFLLSPGRRLQFRAI